METFCKYLFLPGPVFCLVSYNFAAVYNEKNPNRVAVAAGGVGADAVII